MSLMLEYVENQRGQQSAGLRIYSDGRVQRPSAANPTPGPSARLDFPRELAWEEAGQLDAGALEALQAAVRASGCFDLPPKLLINYCKEDPGAAHWTVDLDGRRVQVLVYDPRPRRSPAIDALTAALDQALKTTGA